MRAGTFAAFIATVLARQEAGCRTELSACPALSFPFGGRCVGSRGPGCSGRPAPHFRSRSVGGAWGGRAAGRAGRLSALLPVSLPCRALRGAAETRAARTQRLGKGARYRTAVEAIVAGAPGYLRLRLSSARAPGSTQRGRVARGAGWHWRGRSIRRLESAIAECAQSRRTTCAWTPTLSRWPSAHIRRSAAAVAAGCPSGRWQRIFSASRRP